MLIIFLIALLYLWVIIAVLNNQYSTKQFIYSICGVGFLIATTIFFMNALVEPTHIEIDAKYGTQNLSNHVFYFPALGQALFLFFISSVPILVYKYGPVQGTKIHFGQKTQERKIKPVIIEVEQKQPRPSEGVQSNEQAEWEEATIEDIESGEWEPI